jgi:hypothetical protein
MFCIGCNSLDDTAAAAAVVAAAAAATAAALLLLLLLLLLLQDLAAAFCWRAKPSPSQSSLPTPLLLQPGGLLVLLASRTPPLARGLPQAPQHGVKW